MTPILVNGDSNENCTIGFYEPEDLVTRTSALPGQKDPAQVVFSRPDEAVETLDEEKTPDLSPLATLYPFALMLQGSAPFIASHSGQTAVFHIPGEIIEDPKASSAVLGDIALSWLLGMKIVVVVGCRYDLGECDVNLRNAHECHNALKVTDDATLRHIEEEAGFLRTEVERKLNKLLRVQRPGDVNHNQSGNVVSGNFYTGQLFGVQRGMDYGHTGFVSAVHKENIMQVLKKKDVVMLSTVGMSRHGDLVNVNGYSLAATVASSLNAYKLVFMANEGCILRYEETAKEKVLQELPLSFCQAITSHHQVQCHKTGFATFENARRELKSHEMELLLHMAWAGWALENGVSRCHMVNPGDGALLEELFTSKNGANTCIYHDDERISLEEELEQGVWDAFFESAEAQGQGVATFSARDSDHVRSL